MNALSNILRFKNATHRPCFYLAMMMALGIWFGHQNILSWPWWSMLCGGLIIVSFFRTRCSSVALHLVFFCLGAFSYEHVYIFPSDHIAFFSYKDQKSLQAMEGVIDSDVQTKPTTYGTKKVFEFQIKRIELEGNWQEATGRVLINSYQAIDLNYGDRLYVEGTLFKTHSDLSSKFSYQQYLEDHSLFFVLSVGKKRTLNILSHHEGNWAMEMALKIRHRFKHILSIYLDPQETDMIQAMALGDRSFLTKDIYALFSKTGTSHILAISGMNMAIIVAIVLFILKVLRVSRRWQFILTGLFLFAYALLSGWTASVVRSVVMAFVILGSFCLEHEADTANSLGVAALFLFILNPLTLFDVGFQLSFICVAIIIYLQPLLQPLIEKNIKKGIVGFCIKALCISLISWIGISGIIAYEYGIISPIAIIANIPVVPLADLIIALSLGLVVIGLFCPFLAAAFAGTLKLLFNFMLLLIAWFAQVPGGYFYIQPLEIWHVFVYYLLLMIVYLIVRINPLISRKNYDSHHPIS